MRLISGLSVNTVQEQRAAVCTGMGGHTTAVGTCDRSVRSETRSSVASVLSRRVGVLFTRDVRLCADFG